MGASKKLTAQELTFYREMGKKVFSPEEQAEYIKYFAEGWQRDSILKKMHKSNSTLNVTKKHVPAFAEKLREMITGRVKEVEITAFKGACGEWTEETLEYKAVFDEVGRVKVDEKGQTILQLVGKKVKKLPPEVKILELLLRARMPEIYSNKVLHHDAAVESLEFIKQVMAGKLKEMGPSTTNINIGAVPLEIKEPKSIDQSYGN